MKRGSEKSLKGKVFRRLKKELIWVIKEILRKLKAFKFMRVFFFNKSLETVLFSSLMV
jgi:hypothetical protein